MPLVERSLAAGREARRIAIPELVDAMTRGLESVLGKGDWVVGYGANSVYFSDAFKAQKGETPSAPSRP